MCFLYSKNSYGSPPHRPDKKTKRLRHKHRPGTQGHLLFRFLLVFFLPSLRDAYKKSLLCKSSFVSSPVAIWQFVLLAFPIFLCLLFLHLFLAGIWAGVLFIIVIVALGFLPLALAGISIVRLRVAVGFQHCPFRALLK
jgi:hypothetical protein